MHSYYHTPPVYGAIGTENPPQPVKIVQACDCMQWHQHRHATKAANVTMHIHLPRYQSNPTGIQESSPQALINHQKT